MRFKSERQRRAAFARIRRSEGLPQVDTRQYAFGSVKWQEAMLSNIKLKTIKGEALSPQEREYLKMQIATGRIEVKET
jgi:hypothetical protein